MSNRFHNKQHTNNHHTDATVGDIDSATDPIASSANPFKGNFNLDGDLVVDTIVAYSGSTINFGDDIDITGQSLMGFPLSGCSDVDTTGVGAGNVLMFSSGTWVVGTQTVDPDSIGTTEIEGAVWGTGLLEVGTHVDVQFATTADVIAGSSEILAVSPKSLEPFTAMVTGLKSEREYVKFNAHTTQALTQNSGGPYTYTISGFTGTGLDTAEIRELHVECFCFGGGSHDVKVLASYPDDPTTANRVICRSYGANGDDDCGNGSIVVIPINKDQTSVKFEFSGAITQSFTILGATQRVD